MKLKRIYSISVDPKIAEVIEKVHNTTGKSYVDIFLEAFKEKYINKKKE